jgi:hypothetical protein
MKKSKEIKTLEALAIAEAQKKYPNLPLSHFIATRKYSDNSANALTKCVLDFLKLSGNFAERINTTGIVRDKRKIVTDCIGRTRQIGQLTWIRSGVTRGSSDIHAIIDGKAIFIEIKYGKDIQSKYQKTFEQNVTKAGAKYLIIKSFEEFFNWYKICKQH